MIKRKQGFGMPSFPDRGADLFAKSQDGIYARNLIEFWGEACSEPSEEVQRIIDEGLWAEKQARDILDNRGEV